MNIHEHQAKEILKEYGAPISNGIVVSTDDIPKKTWLNSKMFVLKHKYAGGRGKAGGVKIVKNLSELSSSQKRCWVKLYYTRPAPRKRS